MKLSGLKKQGFSEEEARIISDYSKAGEASPIIRKTAGVMKTTLRGITWFALIVVAIFLLKTTL